MLVGTGCADTFFRLERAVAEDLFDGIGGAVVVVVVVVVRLAPPWDRVLPGSVEDRFLEL
jgi:hypothetical protein